MITRRGVMAAGGLLLGDGVLPEHVGAQPRFDPDVDDTEFVQRAADQGGPLLLRRRYNLRSARPVGGMNASLYLGADNLTIRWAPGAALVAAATIPNYRPLVIHGGKKVHASVISSRTLEAPLLAVLGPIPKGADRIHLARREDIARFRPGDIAYLRTGQLVSASAGEPDAELLEITEVGRGWLRLRSPTSKPYVQEYYDPKGRTSPQPGGAPAPFGIANVTDRILRNVTLQNPQIVEVSPCIQTVSAWGIHGLTIHGGQITHGANGFGSRDVADAEIDGLRFHHTGQVNRLAYFLGPSTGCSRWRMRNIRATSDGFAFLHMHEGVSATSIDDYELRCAGSPDAVDGLIDIRSRAYDIDLGDHFVLEPGASSVPAVQIDPDCIGGRLGAGQIHGRLRILGPNWSYPHG